MNNINLIGRSTKDAELMYMPTTGTAIARFTLAVDREYTKKDGTRDTDFIPVVMYGKGAEFAANNVTKGRLLAITGSLRIDTVKDGDNYNTYTKVECRKIKLLSGKKTDEVNNEQPDEFMDIDKYCEGEPIPFE